VDQHRTFRFQAAILKEEIERDNFGLLRIHPSPINEAGTEVCVVRSQRIVAYVMDDTSRKLKALRAETNG